MVSRQVTCSWQALVVEHILHCCASVCVQLGNASGLYSASYDDVLLLTRGAADGRVKRGGGNPSIHWRVGSGCVVWVTGTPARGRAPHLNSSMPSSAAPGRQGTSFRVLGAALMSGAASAVISSL
jgi:hypothetical protein